LGTIKENEDDKNTKGRRPLGEAIATARLTEEAVRTSREEYRLGISLTELAHRYNVSIQAISFAIKRKTWRHVA
jgi:Zn-dependent peptidase ImmA (M78 family)